VLQDDFDTSSMSSLK